MSDEGAHRKKEAEKAKVETWGQKVTEEEMSFIGRLQHMY